VLDPWRWDYFEHLFNLVHYLMLTKESPRWGTLVCHFWNFFFSKKRKGLVTKDSCFEFLFSQKLQPNKSLVKWPMTISWFTLWNWSIHWSFLPFGAWKKICELKLIQGCKLNPYQCCQVIAFWSSPKDMNRESSFLKVSRMIHIWIFKKTFAKKKMHSWQIFSLLVMYLLVFRFVVTFKYSSRLYVSNFTC